MANETIEQKLQKKINILYNNFITEIEKCDWSLITNNSNGQLLEKNRSIWYMSNPVKNIHTIKNWISKIKIFCFPVKICNSLLNNLNLELIYVICNDNFLKRSYTNICNINCTLRAEFIKKNEEKDYSVVKHENQYYFLTIENFNIISCLIVNLNKKKIKKYKKIFHIDCLDVSLI